MRWSMGFAALLISAFTLAGQGASAAERSALVIGNNAYRYVVPLERAVSDAGAIARELQALGFTVKLHEDLDRRGMNRAVNEFVESITAGGVGFFFYAGHGVQLAGSNYLLPVDIPAINPQRPNELMDEAIEVNRLVERMTEARSRLNLVFLDACRDNPFPRVAGRSVGGSRGLALATVARGTFIVYSAGINEQALDRLNADDSDPNSVFTRTLLPLMRQPGVRIDEVVRRARIQVAALAQQVGHAQNPAYYDQTDGDFYLVAPDAISPAAIGAAPPSGPAAADNGAEIVFWQSVQATSDPAELEAYLRRYPDGTFADLARRRLAALREPADAVASVPAVSEAPATAPATPQQGSPAAAGGLTGMAPATPDATPAAAPDVAPALPAAIAGMAAAAAPVAALPADPAAIEQGIGLTGDHRRQIQRALTALGFNTGGSDGTLGQNSRVAIRRYQEARGLPATAYLTRDLVARILNEARAPLAAEAERQRASAASRPSSQRTGTGTARSPTTADRSAADQRARVAEELRRRWAGQ